MSPQFKNLLPALVILASLPILPAKDNSNGIIMPAERRKSAPDFTLPDANGKPLKLSAYKGKLVLLDFWATWCHGCKTEIPWYVEFQGKYASKGLVVIGVSMDEGGMKTVRPFLAANRIDYPVVIGTDALARSYDLDAMPLTLLIDRAGRVAASHAGVVDKNNFETLIRDLIRRGH